MHSEQAADVNRRRVAKQFSRAAASYDQAAEVQLDIAFDALQLIDGNFAQILDIGCGTGRISRQLSGLGDQVLAIDLAEGMLRYAARQKNENKQVSNVSWLQADAENLPLQANSIELVFSSMALQWCTNAEQVCHEIHRVLVPRGRAVLAIMIEGSMHELSHSWSQVDERPHVNQFYNSKRWQVAALQAGFEITLSERIYTTWHNNVLELLGSIKAIGANVVTEKTDKKVNRTGLSRQNLQQLQDAYLYEFGLNQQLPLSYKVCFLEMQKCRGLSVE
jgi:malonyl-CoA O-methyltransferase